jgi:hypothetical protein
VGGELVPLQPLVAHWALIGKVAGKRQDYNIRARSGGALNVEEIAWDYVPGTPDADLSLNAGWELRWLTFGTHKVGGHPVVSLSIQDRWQHLDQAGRAIWPRRFFACEYTPLAQRDASYSTFTAACLSIDLAKQADLPARLSPRAQSLDRHNGIEAAFANYELKNLAGIAASLLEQPRVAVTGAQSLKPDQRVELLDCIAALLPYGCRAYLTASTDIDPKIGHTIRLVLTEFPGDGQRSVRLGTGESSAPRGQDAERYRKLLLERVETYGLATVLKHLWDDKLTCALLPGAVIDRLSNLHRDEYRSNKMRKSTSVDLHDAVELLEGPADTVKQRWELERATEPQTLVKVLTTLLESEDPRAAKAVRTSFRIIIDDLAALGVSELSSGRLKLPERSLAVAGIANGDQFADALLGLLLTDAQQNPAAWPGEIKNRVTLLRRFPPPAPGQFSYTCDMLRFGDLSEWQALLVHALLSAELTDSETPSRAVGWAIWLGESQFAPEWRYEIPAWVPALAFVATAAADGADLAAVRAAIGTEPHWTHLLLSLARRSGRLVAVLDSGDLDLRILEMARSVGARDASEDYVLLRKQLTELLDLSLWDSGATASSVASTDVVRVLLRGAPRDFPFDRSNNEFAAYLNGMERAMRGLPDDWLRWVQRQILGHVLHGASPARRLPLAAVHLLEAWIRDPRFAPGLKAYVKDKELSGVLEWDHRLSTEFWQILIVEPEFEHLEPMLEMSKAARAAINTPESAFARETRPVRDRKTQVSFTAVKPSPLSEAMFTFRKSGRGPAQILAAMAREWRTDKESDERLPETVPPIQLWRVLREYSGLMADYVPDDTELPPGSAIQVPDWAKAAESDWASCLWLIVHGHIFGRKYGRAFQKMLDTQAGLGRRDYWQVTRIFGNGPFRRLDLPRQRLFRRWLGMDPPPSADEVAPWKAEVADTKSVPPPHAAGDLAPPGSTPPPGEGRP